MTHIEGEGSRKRICLMADDLYINMTYGTVQSTQNLVETRQIHSHFLNEIEVCLPSKHVNPQNLHRNMQTISNKLIIKAQIIPFLPEEFQENGAKSTVTSLLWNRCCLQVSPPWSSFFRCCDTNLSFLPGLLCPSAANPVSRSQCVIILPHRSDPSWLTVLQPLWCWTPTEAHR